MALRDLGAYLDDDVLEYVAVKSSKHPEGKTYRVKSPDAKTGLRLTALANIGLRIANGQAVDEAERVKLGLDDDAELDLYREALGESYDEMVADGVSWTSLQKIGQDAFITYAMSAQTADAIVATQGKAMAAMPPSTPSTAKRTAGSRSRKASTATPAQPRKKASTRSSTSPRGRGAATTATG